LCRLLALAGLGFAPREWLAALRDVARRDPALEREGAENPSHGDGWGLAAFSRGGGGPLEGEASIFHYRSSLPAWEDSKLELAAELVSAPALLIAHVRRASRGTPLGVGAAHPFALHVGRDGGALFVAQNGEVAVEKVPGVAGRVKPGEVVDTFAYAVALADLVEEGGDLFSALSELHRALTSSGGVKRMANTAALLVRREGSRWSAQLGVVRHIADESAERYGELYLHRGEGFTAVASSSLAERMSGLLWEPFRRNAVYVLELSGSGRVEGERWGEL